MKKELVCINCPMGCRMTVELDGETVLSVEGNQCPRGKKYAETECVSPMRTVTSTVRCEDGSLVSVKTDRPIPKESVADCMKIINSATALLPISIGDVIIENVFGCNVIATQNKA